MYLCNMNNVFNFVLNAFYVNSL